MKMNRRKVPCTVDGCEWAGFSFNLAKHHRSHLKRRIRDPVTGLISWVAVEPVLPADPGEAPVDAAEEAPQEAPGEAHNPVDAPWHAPVDAPGDESDDSSEEERMEEDEAERNERMRRQIAKHLRIISKKKRRRPKRKRGVGGHSLTKDLA